MIIVASKQMSIYVKIVALQTSGFLLTKHTKVLHLQQRTNKHQMINK
nr:MAG TPA: hypothetical protein [Caudoviricetes sp.]